MHVNAAWQLTTAIKQLVTRGRGTVMAGPRYQLTQYLLPHCPLEHPKFFAAQPVFLAEHLKRRAHRDDVSYSRVWTAREYWYTRKFHFCEKVLQYYFFGCR